MIYYIIAPIIFFRMADRVINCFSHPNDYNYVFAARLLTSASFFIDINKYGGISKKMAPETLQMWLI